MDSDQLPPGPDGEWVKEPGIMLSRNAGPELWQYSRISIFAQGPNKDQCPPGYTHGPIGEGNPLKSCILNEVVGKTMQARVGSVPGTRTSTRLGTPTPAVTETAISAPEGTLTQATRTRTPGTRTGTQATRTGTEGTRTGTQAIRTGTRPGTEGTRTGTQATRTGISTRVGTGTRAATGTRSSVPVQPPPDMGRLKSMIMSSIDSAFEEFKSSTSGGRRRRTHKRNSRSRR